jgi:hypothetical protein
MKRVFSTAALLLFILGSDRTEASERSFENLKRFANYIYGGSSENISEAVLPHADLWMLRGKQDLEALHKIESMTFERHEDLTVIAIRSELVFLELKGEVVDPHFQLEAIYELHRKLIRSFLYFLSIEDERRLNSVVTDRSLIRVKGASAKQAARFSTLISSLPTCRVSTQTEETKPNSVSYSVPMGHGVLKLSLIKDGNTWKVDTRNGIDVDLQAFLK